MDAPGLVVAFALGSAALALWVLMRFPQLAPETFRGGTVHLCLAILLGQLAVLPIQRIAVDPTGILLSLFALALPALVYSFLACLFLFRLCQQLLGGAVR
jgi:hypothetical protein